MAHGFLSYQDTRGESAIERAIAKIVEDKLDDFGKKIGKSIENRIRGLFAKNIAKGGALAAAVNNQADERINEVVAQDLGSTTSGRGQTPLQRMLGGSAYQKAAESSVINPEVMGGALTKSMGFSGRPLRAEGLAGDAIIDIGATNLGVERSTGDGMFVKGLNSADGGGSTEVVQAIDRLTFVTMSLVAVTKEQTQQQKMIAAAQQQQAEKLARQAKASAEESALEMGGDLSGNSPYQRLLSGATNAMGGSGGRGGGGPGMGIGGKVLAKNILKSATKRGAARTGTRLGAALGGKMLGGMGARMGAKLGAKSVGKIAGGAIAKSLGKKIPLVGLGLGAVFAAQRAMQGDFVGAGLELASGAASTVPGIGTAGSVGIDAALAARDMMTPFAEGGIVSGPTNALIGEEGKEGVFPLSGSEGKKTFIKFGEGVFEAQKRNRKEFAKLQGEGLAEYFDKKPWWENLLDGLKNILPKWLRGGNKNDEEKDPSNRRNRRGAVTPTSTMLPASGTAVKGSYDSFLGGKPALTSGFGLRNTGIAGASTDHRGIDIGVDPGAEVKAIQTGKVVDIYKDFGGHGDGIVVEHADGSRNIYGHVQSQVQVGDDVKAGDKIALIKEWKDPNYPAGRQHLHLERIEGGNHIDPQTYLNKLQAEDQKEVKADVDKIVKDQKKLKPLSKLLENSRETGSAEVEGVGTMTRINRRGGQFQTKFTDSAGNSIDRATFMEKVKSVYGKDSTTSTNRDITDSTSSSSTETNITDQQVVPVPEGFMLEPVSAETGNPLATASQQVMSPLFARGAGTTINNFYGTGANQSGGNAPANVPIAAGSESMGLTSFITVLAPAVV
jgi:murein DD-endopeptidase MepM/ murein hydrolase activator NlpD